MPAMSEDDGGPPHRHFLRTASSTGLFTKITSIGKDKPDLTKLVRRTDAIDIDFAKLAVGTSNENNAKIKPSKKSGNASGTESGGSSRATSRKNSWIGDMSLTETYGIIKGPIAKGGSSTVWLAQLKDKKGKVVELFAVKSFRKESKSSEEDFKDSLVMEFEILSALQHPNVVRTFELLEDEKRGLYEVLEYCGASNMYLYLQNQTLGIGEANCYFKQMLQGIYYLHEKGIVHRDLKPDNLIVTLDRVLKIADFGSAESFFIKNTTEPKMIRGFVGTPDYIAPELFTDEKFHAAPTDMWSVGVIYALMRNKSVRLWGEATQTDRWYQIYLKDRAKEGGHKSIEEMEPHECAYVVYSMLDPKPERRLTAFQALRSEWVRSIEVCGFALRSLSV